MWYKMDEKEPSIGMHVVQVRALHSGSEFQEYAYYYEKDWWSKGNNLLSHYGWEVIAWLDSPDYENT